MSISRHGLSIGIERIDSWFVSGEVKYFDHYDDALQWISE